MRKLNLEISIEIFDWNELLVDDRALLLAAQEATQTSYSPYSQFCVGAAVLLADGTIVKGSNQENAAYPSGLCAERTAIFATGATYPNQLIKAIAVTARPANGNFYVLASPCGACRQSMLEYEIRQQQPIRILIQREDNQVCILPSIESLLPLSFTSKNLV